MAQLHFPDDFTRYIINGQPDLRILTQLEGYLGLWIEWIGVELPNVFAMSIFDSHHPYTSAN